jgi:hypothetical protein
MTEDTLESKDPQHIGDRTIDTNDVNAERPDAVTPTTS